MAALAILWVVLPWRLQAHYTPTDSAQTTAAGKRAESIKMAEPQSDCAKHVSQWLKDRWHIPLTENNRIVVFRTGQEKFDDLFAAARARAAELVQAADGYMAGRVSYASLRALHGGASYDSGMSWQTSCAPSQAPGVRKKASSARSHFRTA